ncbi:rhombosortase [Aliikangiella maris]|uniref:Rhombosortase n=2 Tax=Aliikangiella maris TaxID=3162458 RepID=A0ABV3MI86_9GAMM
MLNIALIRPSRFSVVIILLCIAIQAFSPDSIILLRYEYQAVIDGQWWRLFTANFTHSNWNHLWLNMSGLILIDILFQPLMTNRLKIYLLSGCILFNILLLHCFIKLEWYVGFSGALHGYLVGCALFSFKAAIKTNSFILAVVGIKLFIELNWNINELTANFIQANVVEEAHLSGAVSAIFIYVLSIILSTVKAKEKNI